ncbi:hypothetical protein ACFRCW_47050, partial [Streptomyces sp. NPDC056653]
RSRSSSGYLRGAAMIGILPGLRCLHQTRGDSLLEGRIEPLRAWLEETRRFVPFGTEGLSMDWDEAFAHVLGQWDR